MTEHFDLVIRGGICLTPAGRTETDIGVRAGRITAIGRLGETPADFIENHAYGHLYRETVSEVSVCHSDAYPSCLLVPVTKGNRLGTFMSGGVMPTLEGGH